MDIVDATRHYETWLGRWTTLSRSELNRKHAVMKKSLFGFLRATQYRWVQRWPQVCVKSVSAPRVLACGDLHLENFGTWRDAEARLVWGINDFDDVAPAPYTIDLLRLAVSTLIAADEERLPIGSRNACEAILSGYSAGMRTDQPMPFVLEEAHSDLRALALVDSRSPAKFWPKLTKLRDADPPSAVKAILRSHLPPGAVDVRYVNRKAGGGSLGLPRHVAIGSLAGGLVAREAKARVPPAQVWLGDTTARSWTKHYERRLRDAGRDRDPFVALEGHWLVRRLAPDCERVKIAAIADAPIDPGKILRAMGRATANLHRCDAKPAARIRAHLRTISASALHDEAQRMADDVRTDWKDWRKRGD